MEDCCFAQAEPSPEMPNGQQNIVGDADPELSPEPSPEPSRAEAQG